MKQAETDSQTVCEKLNQCERETRTTKTTPKYSHELKNEASNTNIEDAIKVAIISDIHVEKEYIEVSKRIVDPLVLKGSS